eukprot:TRINITY_DN105878_c0_g1_i1.p1 TRINITY_DN105878_c0_g1~~TRINITY_DN105878_c0_g1_i1.p1  ORF type:complete len:188 (-),score=25.47 TRINITY_DN105878_c0_g1_i1:338-871(-)
MSATLARSCRRLSVFRTRPTPAAALRSAWRQWPALDSKAFSFQSSHLRYLATGRGDVGGGEAEQVSETDFHAHGDRTLHALSEGLDAADLDCIDDLGFDDGVLTVKLEGGQAFVINKHFVTRQIWYASPISGALYFSLQPDHAWRTSEGSELTSQFLEDLCKLYPEADSVTVSSLQP